MKKKIIAMLIGVTAVTVMLAGCATVDVNVTPKSDEAEEAGEAAEPADTGDTEGDEASDQEKADAEFKKAAGERTGYLDQGDFFTVCALVKANKPAQASLVAERMLRESESILADVKHVPYFDRSISSLPGEDDIVRHNEVKGHRGKAFALMLLGKRKQAAEEVAEVKEWHGLTEWLKIAQMKGDRY